MEIEQEAKKEIERMEKVLEGLKVLRHEGKEIFELVNSYFTDAKHFYQNKKFLQSFEAAVICWTYVDSGLHLKLFSVNEEVKKFFTI